MLLVTVNIKRVHSLSDNSNDSVHHMANASRLCKALRLSSLCLITHSLFRPRLKTFLFRKSFPLQLFLFFFRTDYMIPQTFAVTSEHIRFYFF